MYAIETEHLSRRFGAQTGVEAINLQVPAGTVYGFLGPNGAGKTTSMRLLLGLLRPDSGHIVLNGKTLDAKRMALAGVGAMIESPSLYPHLSGRQNLEVTRRLLGLPALRIDAALATVALEKDGNRRAGDYSLGMKQRLGIAQALLQEPKLLILDEPNNGLDPEGIVQMRRLLKHLALERGITVMVSSHQLSEIEQIADHIGLIVEGRMRFQGSLQALQAMHHPALRIQCQPIEAAQAVLQSHGLSAQTCDDSLIVENAAIPAQDINRLLVNAGIAVCGLTAVPATLESLFFTMTSTDTGNSP